MTSKKEIDEMARKIKDWIVDEGHFQSVPVTETDHWRYIVKMGNTTVEMFQPKEKQDCVVIIALTNFSPEHKVALVDPKNSRILQLLQLELVRGGVQVELKADPTGPIAFAVLDLMYYDGLTKDMMYQRLQRLVNVRVSGVLLINSLIGINLPPGKVDPALDQVMFG